jgi:hypothetical protein
MATSPRSTAVARGDTSCDERAVGCMPWASSACAAARCPSRAARPSGVVPSVRASEASAPASSRVATACGASAATAVSRAVSPVGDCAFASAPAASSARSAVGSLRVEATTTSGQPEYASVAARGNRSDAAATRAAEGRRAAGAAPAASSVRACSRRAFLAAYCTADWPARSTAETSAPALSSRAQACGDSAAQASIRGVIP